MEPAPSLLDWLKFKLGQPRLQRVLRFGLAGLFLMWGGGQLFLGQASPLSAFFVAGLGVGLFIWGLFVRGAPAPVPGLPDLTLAPQPRAEPAASGLSREALRRLLAALRLPSALVLAVSGQAMLIYQPQRVVLGVLLLALGTLTFVGLLLYDRLLGAPRAAPATEGAPLVFRWGLLALAGVAGAVAFLAAGGNQFRWGGVAAWVISVAAWLAAVWDVSTPPAEVWPRLRARLSAWVSPRGVTLRLSRLTLLFLAVLAVGAYFRFARLDAIPPEMTSDHVEKLLDVNDLLNGRHWVFFERNTGREPLQFYFAALLDRVLHTGVTFLTLKLTGAIAGLLLLPTMFFLGRELEDDLLGLIAMLLAGVGIWATTISRVGLRFPLTPLFVAPLLLFLLRGVRRQNRNDFLAAGVFLGAGLYGYSTFRMAPFLVVACVTWFALWPQPGASRRRLLAHSILLFATAFIVFLPLYRYAVEPGSAFWERTFSRLSDTERAIDGSLVALFIENTWNGLRMFNWLGDKVWVNTLPGRPALDFITGALFLFGAAFLLLRLALRRDRVAGLLLLAIPILLLPSTLSFAFPEENPSVVRAGGAIPVVYLLAAYPLWLLFRHWRGIWPAATGRLAAASGVGVVLAAAALVNAHMYFNLYPAQYIGSAQNASEIGQVVHDFAHSVGSYDRAWLCLHPHWADTRAVGIYAGQIGWELVLPPERLGELTGDPRALLLILNPRGADCIAAARQIFPTGVLSRYSSARSPDKDFLLYFVPSTADLDERTLPFE
jgi:hypothetical protein